MRIFLFFMAERGFCELGVGCCVVEGCRDLFAWCILYFGAKLRGLYLDWWSYSDGYLIILVKLSLNPLIIISASSFYGQPFRHVQTDFLFSTEL